MGYWNDGHMSAGWALFMLLGMVLFLAVVVVGIVWIVRTTQAPRPPVPPSLPPAGAHLSNAEQVLADRLARGEIEPEEYQARLAVLRTPR